jgi:hypothetical protein
MSKSDRKVTIRIYNPLTLAFELYQIIFTYLCQHELVTCELDTIRNMSNAFNTCVGIENYGGDQFFSNEYLFLHSTDI